MFYVVEIYLNAIEVEGLAVVLEFLQVVLFDHRDQINDLLSGILHLFECINVDNDDEQDEDADANKDGDSGAGGYAAVLLLHSKKAFFSGLEVRQKRIKGVVNDGLQVIVL